METEEIIRNLQERVERLEHDHNRWTTVTMWLAIAMALLSVSTTCTHHTLRHELMKCCKMVNDVKQSGNSCNNGSQHHQQPL